MKRMMICLLAMLLLAAPVGAEQLAVDAESCILM